MSSSTVFDTSEYIDTMDSLLAGEEESATTALDNNNDDNNGEAPEHVGLALLLVFGAGAATAIGAAVVFVPRLVTLASPKKLAGSIGFSAGVMLFVSFAEILLKSRTSFMDAGKSEEAATVLSMICFMAGVIFMLVRALLLETISNFRFDRLTPRLTHCRIVLPWISSCLFGSSKSLF